MQDMEFLNASKLPGASPQLSRFPRSSCPAYHTAGTVLCGEMSQPHTQCSFPVNFNIVISTLEHHLPVINHCLKHIRKRFHK